MQISYDPEADAMYVDLTEPQGQVRSDRIDHQRILDYDESGTLVGIEFLFLSEGLRIADLPQADAIRELLASLRSIPQPASA